MSTPAAVRVARARERKRRSGLRLVQLWVPDTRQPGFAEACRQQSARVAQADARDAELARWMDEALAQVDGWTD